MCGFLFAKKIIKNKVRNNFENYLNKISWRGPDSGGYIKLDDGDVYLGHRRLSIVDASDAANQPMISSCGRYYLLFNGEIFNFKKLAVEFNLSCKTKSDSEVLIEGYKKIGDEIFNKIEGMFAIVIFDKYKKSWVAARDPLGIKPLYLSRMNDQEILCSEAFVIADMIESEIDSDSVDEWRLMRRPVPGYSFFKNVNELLPGYLYFSDKEEKKYFDLNPSLDGFSQECFEKILVESVEEQEFSDFLTCNLLSAGLDSAVISAISSSKNCYTVGLNKNNEFVGANETAKVISKNIRMIEINEDKLISNWKYLVRLRGEPISVPNEGLIYEVCKNMRDEEKVVLTGEGADELLFGYDKIYRWAISLNSIDVNIFCKKYGYSSIDPTKRLSLYISEMMENKSAIEFVEDFFIYFHLPGLLRRMDFSSMAASKEVRVPFISKNLIKYMYRRESSIKIDNEYSKIPLRNFAKKLGLEGALNRKKIGFSTFVNRNESTKEYYAKFQNLILEELNW